MTPRADLRGGERRQRLLPRTSRRVRRHRLVRRDGRPRYPTSGRSPARHSRPREARGRGGRSRRRSRARARAARAGSRGRKPSALRAPSGDSGCQRSAPVGAGDEARAVRHERGGRARGRWPRRLCCLCRASGRRSILDLCGARCEGERERGRLAGEETGAQSACRSRPRHFARQANREERTHAAPPPEDSTLPYREAVLDVPLRLSSLKGAEAQFRDRSRSLGSDGLPRHANDTGPGVRAHCVAARPLQQSVRPGCREADRGPTAFANTIFCDWNGTHGTFTIPQGITAISSAAGWRRGDGGTGQPTSRTQSSTSTNAFTTLGAQEGRAGPEPLS